jgi:hypothetical protein
MSAPFTQNHGHAQDSCRKLGVNEPPHSKFQGHYLSVTVSTPAQPRELQGENGRLKRMHAERALIHKALKDFVNRKL